MKLKVTLLLLMMLTVQAQGLGTDLAPIKIPDILQRRESTTKINVIVDSTFFAGSPFNILDIIDGLESQTYSPGAVNYAGSYVMDITVTNMSSAEHSNLIDFLSTIDQTGSKNGYELNSTAFNNGMLNNTFNPITGRAYDANDTLNWIADNLWDQDSSRYSLFLLNLEELDIDALDHWFTIKPNDVDTDTYSDKFFSSTYGLIEGKQVSAWGGVGDLPVQFVDISSKVWFGDFINEVWGGQYQDTTLSKNLDNFLDRSNTVYLQWLRRMILPFFDNLFSLMTFTPTILEHPDINDKPTYQIPSVVLVEDENQTTEDSWVISQSKMNNILGSAFPFLNFNATVTWLPLANQTSISNAIYLYTKSDTDGQQYIELTDGLLNYLQINQIDKLFGDIDEYTIPSIIFYLNNIEFRYYGTPIAGLGGMGWQLQIIHDNRLYNPDGTHGRGFSSVLLHEIGHSMGFFHPFSKYDSWISDFTASIVGYYTSFPDFSIYEKDALARLYADYFIIQSEYLQLFAGDDRDTINGNIEYLEALLAYDQREYASAVDHARNSVKAYQSEKPVKTESIINTTINPNVVSTDSLSSPALSLNLRTPTLFLGVFVIHLLVNRRRKWIK